MILRSYNKQTFTASEQEDKVDDVKSQMEGVTRVYVELDNKISDKGGVQNLFGMNRKIRQALETISIGELDSMIAEIHRAKEGLTRLQEDVVEIRVLKEVLSAPQPKQVNGSLRAQGS
jgi:uncharacterized protein YwgA